MPNPSAAKKTALAPKKLLSSVVAVAVSIVASCLLLLAFDVPKLQVNGRTYRLDVARTQAKQELGLGGRASMATNHGMLFIYVTPGPYCYWMKGMQFPLDIIWLDSGRHVIKIEPNLSPKTYPQSYCPPKANAEYVIELNAGQAAVTHMYLGEQLKF